jgi:ParB-like chromosome segregation protein Spo0J
MLLTSMVKRIDRGSAPLPPPKIDIQIERWPIERLVPRANNPRTHSLEQIANIAASIRELCFKNPILVGSDDDVIAGHARLLASRKLGMADVAVIVLKHLSSAQRRALVIADNQLFIAGAGWDEEMLRAELPINARGGLQPRSRRVRQSRAAALLESFASRLRRSTPKLAQVGVMQVEKHDFLP